MKMRIYIDNSTSPISATDDDASVIEQGAPEIAPAVAGIYDVQRIAPRHAKEAYCLLQLLV